MTRAYKHSRYLWVATIISLRQYSNTSKILWPNSHPTTYFSFAEYYSRHPETSPRNLGYLC